MNDPGEMRASDAEREAVVEHLKEASVEGRLTLTELTERTEAAYTSTTQAQLQLLITDLPAGGGPPRAATPYQRQGAKRRWFVAVMGDTKKRGPWRVDGELGAVAVMGDILIDLREAEVRGNAIDIVATSVMGDIKIIVPDGVEVDLEGLAIMGSKRVDVLEAPRGMDVPVVRVKAFALMGDIKIIGDSQSKPLKQGLSAWREQWRELRGDRDPRGDREDRRERQVEFRQQWHQLRAEARDQWRELHSGDRENWRELQTEAHEQWRELQSRDRDRSRRDSRYDRRDPRDGDRRRED